MTVTTIYTCDVCGNNSTDSKEIIKCECSHLGITPNTLKCWKQLQDNVENISHINSIFHNSETDAAFDDAVKKLIEFENKHKLTGKKIPARC